MATYSSINAWEAAQGSGSIVSAPAVLSPADAALPAAWESSPPTNPSVNTANTYAWINQPIKAPTDGLAIVANQVIIS